MHYAKIPKVLRQVTPRDAGAVAVQDGIDEQAVIACRCTGLACLAGQQQPISESASHTAILTLPTLPMIA